MFEFEFTLIGTRQQAENMMELVRYMAEEQGFKVAGGFSEVEVPATGIPETDDVQAA